MDGSTREPNSTVDKTLKRTGLTGVGLGVLALLACEAPLFLAIIGLAGLSESANRFRSPPAIEIAAIGFFVLGAAALMIMLARALLRTQRLEDQ